MIKNREKKKDSNKTLKERREKNLISKLVNDELLENLALWQIRIEKILVGVFEEDTLRIKTFELVKWEFTQRV